MFSGSASSEAARKSATARRRANRTPNEELDRAQHDRVMSRQVDWLARQAFLNAFSAANPAALENLTDTVQPAIQRWLPPVPATSDPLRRQLLRLKALRDCTLSTLGQDRDGESLRTAIESWMGKFGFVDPWIGDAALVTLVWASLDGSRAPTRLIVFPDPAELEPRFELALRWRGDELLPDFRQRARLAYQRQMKEYVALVQFRRGERKEQKTHARWTAKAFLGCTYADIATADRLQGSEDAIRKGVVGFAKRIKLTPPALTLADSLAGAAGKSGKTRDRKAIMEDKQV